MSRIFTLVFVLLLAACSERKETANANDESKAAVSAGRGVVVLGGETTSAFADGLRAAGVTHAKACSSESVAERAKLLASADVAMILVDATQGPLPVNREDVLLSRQFCRGPVMIGFSRSAAVDDPELLELEELEMRELLNSYELPGDSATLCFDSEQAKTKHPKGFPAIAGLLSKLEPVAEASPLQSVREIEASVYVLADAEAFKRSLVRPIEGGTFRVLFGEHEVDAELRAEKAIQPGSSGPVSIAFPQLLNLPPGARFVISREGHAIAAGAIMPSTGK